MLRSFLSNDRFVPAVNLNHVRIHVVSNFKILRRDPDFSAIHDRAVADTCARQPNFTVGERKASAWK